MPPQQWPSERIDLDTLWLDRRVDYLHPFSESPDLPRTLSELFDKEQARELSLGSDLPIHTQAVIGKFHIGGEFTFYQFWSSLVQTDTTPYNSQSWISRHSKPAFGPRPTFLSPRSNNERNFHLFGEVGTVPIGRDANRSSFRFYQQPKQQVRYFPLLWIEYSRSRSFPYGFSLWKCFCRTSYPPPPSIDAPAGALWGISNSS